MGSNLHSGNFSPSFVTFLISAFFHLFVVNLFFFLWGKREKEGKTLTREERIELGTLKLSAWRSTN